jgi:hypothetical protein
MNARRYTLAFGLQLAWEFVRFFGLFALLLFRFRPTLLDDPAAILWLVVLGSTQLLVPAGLLFLILDEGRRGVLLPFVRLGKILQLFPALLLIFILPFGRGLPHLPLLLLPPKLTALPFLLAGALVDLIFLFFLFGARDRDAARGLTAGPPVPPASAPPPETRPPGQPGSAP